MQYLYQDLNNSTQKGRSSTIPLIPNSFQIYKHKNSRLQKKSRRGTFQLCE